MNASNQVNYCRKGYKETVLTVVKHDEEKKTLDLANAAGKVVVTECPFFVDPKKVEKLPDGYACPVGGDPDHILRQQAKAAEEESAKKAAEEAKAAEAAKKAAEESKAAEAAKKAAEESKDKKPKG